MVAGGQSASYRPPLSFCGPMPSSGGDAPSREEGLGQAIPAFFNGIMSPFIACWHPPVDMCVKPAQSMSPSPVVSPYSMSPQSSGVVALTTNIRTPHPNDVLCGRGGNSNRHVGNLNFRSLVAANKETYVTLTKKQKMMMARAIVGTIHGQDPPGRFLQKDPETGLWSDIGMPRSLEKTSQALREKTHSSDRDATSSTGSLDYPDDEARSPSPVGHSVTPVHSPKSAKKVVSPIATHNSKNGVEPPQIVIPDHLEEQFNPHLRQMRASQRHPASPPHGTWSPPLIPQVAPQVPPQTYMPSFQGSPQRIARPAVPYASAPVYPPPYGQTMPIDHREYMMPPPASTYPPARQPPTPYPPMQPRSATIPPSPPRLMTPAATAAPSTPVSQSAPKSHGRPGGKISPGRAHESKRRRQGSPSSRARQSSSSSSNPNCLSQDMHARLSLKDEHQELQNEIASPSGVLQSRSPGRGGDKADPLAGLAALSSAALLKLDEEDK